MKPRRGEIAKYVDRPGDGLRFYLFWGPDEGQSRALATRLIQALGADRFIVISGAVKNDPATLVDEAGALSLFGGRRVIWIEPAGDDIAAAVATLLEAVVVESPVVAIASATVRPKELIRLAETSEHALAFASYAPEGEEAERLVIDLGRRVGLTVPPHLASRIAEAAGNDQAIISGELEKLALYVDASTSRPQTIDEAALDAIGANRGDGEILHLADLALAGAFADLADALGNMSGAGEAIPVVRALQRRLLMLAPIRAKVEDGQRPDAVMASMGKALFWKDKTKVAAMVARWSADDLIQLADRAAALEHRLLFSAAPEAILLGEELIAIARAARRR